MLDVALTNSTVFVEAFEQMEQIVEDAIVVNDLSRINTPEPEFLLDIVVSYSRKKF